VGATGYGPIRFSNLNPLDDPKAFTSGARTTYKSPLSGAASCGNNYIVLVGNTYPKAEANNGGPTIFNGINYTPTSLSAITSDTSRYADEWAQFVANADVSDIDGKQHILTYAINTYNAKPDADQGKLLRSMAEVGGRLGEDREAGARAGQGGEVLARWRERGETRPHRQHGCAAQAFASSFFLSCAFGTAPMTWSMTLPPLTKRIVGIDRIP
jgi:type IV pilus assembly protein PilY1